MKQTQHILQLKTSGQGLYCITNKILHWVADQDVNQGLLTCFLSHTSASLTIVENADPDVLKDLNDYYKELVPKSNTRYRHSAEGLDDMPAHIKTVLTSVNLTIPVSNKKPVLGTWQGVYLFEHRDRPHTRNIVLHLLGH